MSLLSFAKKIAGRPDQQIKTKKKTASVVVAERAHSDNKAFAHYRAAAIIPSLTEKSVSMQAKTNTYAFAVAPETTKGQISAAVKLRYKVSPIKVRVANRLAKRRRRGKTVGLTNAWKRAYVTLPKGESIDLTV